MKDRKEYNKEYYKENKDNIKEYYKEYYKENKDNIKEYNKEYYKENKDNIKEYNKEYYKENKDNIKEYKKEYRKERYYSDKEFRIKSLLRNRLLKSMKAYTEKGKITSSKYMGIHWKLVVKYLIKRFPSDFYEREYHIDHIIPLSKFNFEDSAQIKVAFSPKNHQWLLAEKNLSKGSKYEWLIAN